MPTKKLKDVTCLDIFCKECPLAYNGECGSIKIDQTFGDFVEKNPTHRASQDINLEKEVEVDE